MGVETLVVGSLLLGAAGINEQRKANADARAANRAQQRAAAIQNARARRQALAQSIQSQATVTSQAVNSGIGSSSTLSGISSSINSQISSNLSFQNQLEQLDVQRFNYLDSASKHAAKGDTFSGLSSMAMMGAQNYSSIQSLWKKP